MRGDDFAPPSYLRHGHLQTLWANWAPRPARLRDLVAASTVHDVVVGDDRVRVHLWREGSPRRPLLVVLHGLTGCAGSPQVLGLGDKAVRAGFDLLRVDLRNASGDTPSREVGHAGRSEDLLAVVDWARERMPGIAIAVAAYSLGGNVALRAAGERGTGLAEEVRALAVISVPIDLNAASAAIDCAINWPYRAYFLRRLCQIVARRRVRYPEVYGNVDLHDIATLRAFDDAVVAPLCGFADAGDYYARCSAIARIELIDRPTLLIQAADDPFIPITSYRDVRLAGNPHLQVLLSARGGHAGFWARRRDAADRFWAERRAVEFLRQRAG